VTFVSKETLSKLPSVLLGGGVGAGATIALILADKEPKLLIQTFFAWGPASLIGLVAMVLVSQGISKGFTTVVDFGEKLLQVGREVASSQEKLAGAVNEIAKKDDQEAYEQRVLMGHIGTQTEKILTRFDELERRMNDADREKARGASA
jgi:multidrug efflux pump subunit AcrB